MQEKMVVGHMMAAWFMQSYCGQGLAVAPGTKLAILKGGRSAKEHGGGGLGVGRVCTDLLWEET